MLFSENNNDMYVMLVMKYKISVLSKARERSVLEASIYIKPPYRFIGGDGHASRPK